MAFEALSRLLLSGMDHFKREKAERKARKKEKKETAGVRPNLSPALSVAHSGEERRGGRQEVRPPVVPADLRPQ